MWIFTSTGFVSAVVHRDDPDLIVVRARDLESLTPLIERTGAEVVNEDVNTCKQREERLETGGVVEVECDRALVVVDPGEGRTELVARRPLPERVAGCRLLNLDHVRPKLGHQSRREGRGDVTTDFEDLHASQRPRHLRSTGQSGIPRAASPAPRR
jgi:hypothetical protein